MLYQVFANQMKDTFDSILEKYTFTDKWLDADPGCMYEAWIYSHSSDLKFTASWDERNFTPDNLDYQDKLEILPERDPRITVCIEVVRYVKNRTAGTITRHNLFSGIQEVFYEQDNQDLWSFIFILFGSLQIQVKEVIKLKEVSNE
jgi:hypothetical protein